MILTDRSSVTTLSASEQIRLSFSCGGLGVVLSPCALSSLAVAGAGSATKMATYKPKGVKDVDAENFIKAYSAHLKVIMHASIYAWGCPAG